MTTTCTPTATPRPLAMAPEQHRVCARQYAIARGALEILAEAPLNLDTETRRALDDARGALERFDYLRCQQPTKTP